MKSRTPLHLRLIAVLLLLLISGAVGTGPLSAQSVAQRRAVEAFADSIAPVSDTAFLLALETKLMTAARRDRANPAAHLTLGQLALRLGHFDDAASEFKWATQLEPQWPYPWFGLGIAEFGAGTDKSAARDGRRALLGRDAWTRAAAAWTRAVTLEPAFAGRLERLGHTALARGDRDQATVIREALRRASAPPRSGHPVGAVVLARARFERELGDTASALAVFETVTWEDGRAQALLEQARVRFVTAAGDGSEPYYAGARLDDSIVVAQYRRDLTWIATPAELAEFDHAAGPDRAEFLWSFWTGRDRQALRASGDRLREHYRRLELAARQFEGDSLDSSDPRVAVWIRHGAPEDRITGSVAGVVPNETWRFKRARGDLVLHFGARAPGGYAVLPTLLDL
ncbi:MAG: GWxTD domain-containing protein, partial [Gemmatimonadota bacterium]